MNKLIALLTGLIMIGANLSALAGPDMSKVKTVTLEGEQLIHNVMEAKDLTKDQKMDILSQALLKAVRDLAIEESYIDWFIDGINRAVGASPPRLVDSFPPNLENADIPEFLVKNLVNFNTLQKVKNDTVGAKPSTVLVLSVKVTPDEFRRLSDRDSIINFFINNEERIFFEVQK